jgi:phosphoribosylaminoimidazole (AIR) synthetase
MALMVGADQVDRALQTLTAAGQPASAVGTVVAGPAGVRFA